MTREKTKFVLINIKKINKQQERRIYCEEKCIIFGASTRGKYAVMKLKDEYEVVEFSDNDMAKWGKL